MGKDDTMRHLLMSLEAIFVVPFTHFSIPVAQPVNDPDHRKGQPYISGDTGNVGKNVGPTLAVVW
jgi:hypothetical protein